MNIFFTSKCKLLPLRQSNLSQVWWLMPVVPAFRKLKQEDLHEFKVSLGYMVSSRPPRATKLNPISKITNKAVCENAESEKLLFNCPVVIWLLYYWSHVCLESRCP